MIATMKIQNSTLHRYFSVQNKTSTKIKLKNNCAHLNL